MQVNILDAKNRLSQLIKSVESGGEVVIANRGKPVARLVPVGRVGATSATGTTHATAADGRGEVAAILRWLDQNPLPAYTRRAAHEINASVQSEREAWD